MCTQTLLMVGPIPPPVHGQSVATKAILQYFQRAGLEIEAVDTGGGDPKRRTSSMFRRLARHFFALRKILSGKGPVYLSANSNQGLWLTAALAASARWAGRHVMVHYHSYAAANTSALPMRALSVLGGRRAVHVVLCKAMALSFKKRYSSIQNILVLNNAGFVEVPAAEIGLGRARHGRVRVGHLSNLCEEKGIGEVLHITSAAVMRGADIELVVAGPIKDDFANRAIAEAKTRLGDRIKYVGPVYGTAKQEFFEGIDMFLFPTKYRNEAQPLVVFEAMAAGVQTIATRCACIPDDLGSSAGKTEELDRLLSALLDVYAAIQKDSSRARSLARMRFEELLSEHDAQLSMLMSSIGPTKGPSL